MDATRDISSAYSISGRSNHHYNSSLRHRNQYANPNIARLHNNFDSKLAAMRQKQSRARNRDRRTQSLASMREVSDDRPLIEQLRQGRYRRQRTGTSSVPRNFQRAKVPKAPGSIYSAAGSIGSIEEVEEKLDQILAETPGHAPQQGETESVPPDQCQDTQKEPVDTSEIPEEGPCILSDPECPPCGATDHYLGRCSCHLCTCGEHICPNEYRNQLASTKVPTRSSYGMTYKPVRYEVPERFHENPQLTSSNLPMALQTTHRNEYRVAGKGEYSAHVSKPVTPVQNEVKFVGRTSYEATFPNWGPYSPESFSPNKLPYRGGDVKFSSKSAYQESFFNTQKPCPSKTYRPTPNLSIGQEFYGETTNHAFKAGYDQELQTLSMKTKAEPIILHSVPFKSQAQETYKGKQPRFSLPMAKKAK